MNMKLNKQRGLPNKVLFALHIKNVWIHVEVEHHAIAEVLISDGGVQLNNVAYVREYVYVSI